MDCFSLQLNKLVGQCCGDKVKKILIFIKLIVLLVHDALWSGTIPKQSQF